MTSNEAQVLQANGFNLDMKSDELVSRGDLDSPPYFSNREDLDAQILALLEVSV